MILLENQSVIIQNVLAEKFVKPSKIDIQFVDFDNVRFHLSTPESRTILILSMGITCWPDLVKYGAKDVLQREFGDWLIPDGSAEKEADYDVSLRLDLEKIPEEGDDREALISHLSHIKSTLLSSPFHLAYAKQAELAQAHQQTFQAGAMDQQAGANGELMQIRWREEEAFFVQASWDRVTVFFSTRFKEETDRVFGRVFLQEFVDARRLPSIQTAPQVMFTNRDPPLELRNVSGLKRSEDVGYVTFVLFPRHFASAEQANTTTLRLLTFRNFLHYQIKRSKAYMHSRMRFRVASFLRILNRAKPETIQAERKTATGRTFRQS